MISLETAYCDALKFALDFEVKGEKFYRESIEKVDDPHAQKTLQFLAAEESHHIDKIERFNQSLINKEHFDLSNECDSKLVASIENYLDEFIKNKEKTIAEKASDVEIYDVAMEMENSGYQMYKKAFDENQDNRLRKFFKFLMNEESLHYNLILASKKYLEEPSYYFEDFGGWIFS